MQLSCRLTKSITGLLILQVVLGPLNIAEHHGDPFAFRRIQNGVTTIILPLHVITNICMHGRIQNRFQLR
ncbi:hypothetical protein D3C76_1523170 [compost metagenome]